MIEFFNDTELRDSGIIYASTFEQIKKLHAVDPDKAGELAISAIELLLTGEISSDDVMIELMLTTTKAVNQKKQIAYDKKVANTKNSKISTQKLDMIAEMLGSGMSQTQIAKKIGASQQTVSNRIKLIKQEFPELLQGKCLLQDKTGTSLLQEKNTCTNVVQEENVCTNVVQPCTNDYNFVF